MDAQEFVVKKKQHSNTTTKKSKIPGLYAET